MTYRAPYLTYDKIRGIAENFLQKYHPEGTLPVPIEKIVEIDLGMDIVPYWNLFKDFGVDGYLTNDLMSIYVDQFMQSDRENRYRFTLAQELGHLVLHKDLYKDSEFESVEDWIAVQDSIDADQYTWYERHANNFAGLILVPEDPLYEEYRRCIEALEEEDYQLRKADVQIINGFISVRLAKLFAVSEQVVTIRLDKDELTPFTL